MFLLKIFLHVHEQCHPNKDVSIRQNTLLRNKVAMSFSISPPGNFDDQIMTDSVLSVTFKYLV